MSQQTERYPKMKVAVFLSKQKIDNAKHMPKGFDNKFTTYKVPLLENQANTLQIFIG